jgi:hypothetical protein
MIVYDASQAGLVELQSARNAIHHRTLRATAEAVRQPGGLTVSQPKEQRTAEAPTLANPRSRREGWLGGRRERAEVLDRRRLLV